MARAQVVASLTTCLLLAACGPRQNIIVGSKDFTEQEILAEIAAQQIERRLNVPVERKLNLGGTLLAHQALVKGEIDLYPEYTGTAYTTVLKQPISRDAAAVETRVRNEYRSRWDIEWMPSLGFNNTFAMVVRDGSKTLSQAAARAAPWKLGIGYEFLTRPDGLAGLVDTYKLRLDGAPRSMALGLLYQALRQNQVEMVAGSITDGPIAAMGFTALIDDKHYFPPYEAAMAVRGPAIEAHPGLQEAIQELSGKISTETMRKMNYEVDGKHRPFHDVAKEFLEGLR